MRSWELFLLRCMIQFVTLWMKSNVTFWASERHFSCVICAPMQIWRHQPMVYVVKSKVFERRRHSSTLGGWGSIAFQNDNSKILKPISLLCLHLIFHHSSHAFTMVTSKKEIKMGHHHFLCGIRIRPTDPLLSWMHCNFWQPLVEDAGYLLFFSWIPFSCRILA